jgi:isopentenyldiphosphate isomerase
MQREKEIHEIEVHVASLCIRETLTNFEFLIGKRANDRLIFPGFWECGGGQVHKGKSFIEAVEYHMKEEFGIQVDVLFPFCTYKIDLKEKMIPGVRFICRVRPNETVKIDHQELVDHRWISLAEINDYNMIPGLREDIMKGLDFYQKINQAQQKNPSDRE